MMCAGMLSLEIVTEIFSYVNKYKVGFCYGNVMKSGFF